MAIALSALRPLGGADLASLTQPWAKEIILTPGRTYVLPGTWTPPVGARLYGNGATITAGPGNFTMIKPQGDFGIEDVTLDGGGAERLSGAETGVGSFNLDASNGPCRVSGVTFLGGLHHKLIVNSHRCEVDSSTFDGDGAWDTSVHIKTGLDSGYTGTTNDGVLIVTHSEFRNIGQIARPLGDQAMYLSDGQQLVIDDCLFVNCKRAIDVRSDPGDAQILNCRFVCEVGASRPVSFSGGGARPRRIAGSRFTGMSTANEEYIRTIDRGESDPSIGVIIEGNHLETADVEASFPLMRLEGQSHSVRGNVMWQKTYGANVLIRAGSAVNVLVDGNISRGGQFVYRIDTAGAPVQIREGKNYWGGTTKRIVDMANNQMDEATQVVAL